MVQRGHSFAIVDEVDSILIDEARTPLIISGPLEDRADLYTGRRRDHARMLRRSRGLRARRKAAPGVAHRTRQRARRGHAGREGPDEGLAVRHRERLARPPRQLGAEGAQAVPARPRLHRQRRRGRHHRRVHRPHDAGPALLGRPAPGARGQGARRDPAREPDAGLHHLPELLPPLQEARRHDRHRRHRGQRVHGHLRPRRRRDPDQRHGAAGSTRTTRSIARRRRSTPPSCRRSPTATAAASRSSSAPCRSRSPSSCRSC